MRTVKLEEACESGVHTTEVECEEVLVQASNRLTLKAASPWLLLSVGAFGHFPKRDNELDGGVYTFKTEPDG